MRRDVAIAPIIDATAAIPHNSGGRRDNTPDAPQLPQHPIACTAHLRCTSSSAKQRRPAQFLLLACYTQQKAASSARKRLLATAAGGQGRTEQQVEGSERTLERLAIFFSLMLLVILRGYF